jgi:hypothetical protein
MCRTVTVVAAMVPAPLAGAGAASVPVTGTAIGMTAGAVATLAR